METKATSRYAEICKSASNQWLLRQLRFSIGKWLTISQPDGFVSLSDFEREVYGDNDMAVIDEIERRLDTTPNDKQT